MINNLKKLYLQKIKKLYLPRDIIRDSIRKNHDKLAVIDRERKISYGELYKRAKRLINSLTELGINKGDRVAVLMYNCQEYFELRIASYLSGVVLVPLVWDMDIRNIIFILNDCNVKLFIYHPEIIGKNIKKIKKSTKVKNFIPVTKENNASSYKELLSKASSGESRIRLMPNDLASINFSSGTTGKPKGVLLTHKNWIDSFYNYVLNSSNSRIKDIRILHLLSFATAGGGSFLPTFFLGAKNVILSKFSPKECVELIKKYNINTLFLTPTYLIEISNYCRENKVSLSSLKRIIIGTEPISRDKLKQMINFFGPIIQQGYGMAEVLPPLTLLSSEDYVNKNALNEERLFSVGKILDGVKIRIINNEGKQLPPGKVGKIVISSSTVSKGYWNNEKLTKEHYIGGWFYTNDFGYIDKEGYLYVCGRKQDIIMNLDGKIIFRKDIEEILNKHSDVLDAFVFSSGKMDIIGGVSLKNNSKKIQAKELIQFCKDRLDNDIVPEKIIILPNLPKNASGKTDINKLRYMLLRGKRNG